MKIIRNITVISLLLISVSFAKSYEEKIADSIVKPIECQIIDYPEQRMTLCIENKGLRSLRSAACGFVVAGLCWSNAVSAPLMLIALPIVKAAKDRGAFRDQGECEEIARDGGRLGAILGADGAIAGVLAGKCGECVCRAAY